jgi:CRP/FNR family transcriptional regulator, nitrogen oxide reductase regulator
MTRAEISAAVAQLKPRFFDGLTAPELKTVLDCARPRAYLAGSVVHHEGHPGDRMFLLLSGRARFFTLTPEGDKVLLFWAVPGEVLGGAATLARQCDYLLSSETVKDSRFLVWSRTNIAALCQQYPRLMSNALLIAHDYMVLYRALHLSLACHSARQRLATVLVNLATGIGQRVPEGVELDVNNEELANEAHVTHFTASRLMSEWQRSGVLIKRRGKVLLSSPELLFSQQS